MPVEVKGLTRFRKNQIGYQGSNASVLLTKATATYVLPMRGVPDVNPNWTDPDVDTGSLFRVIAPYRIRGDYTLPLEGPLTYNSAAYLFAMSLEGFSAPTGATAKTWTFQPASTGSPEPLGFFTVEHGDDVDGVGEAYNDWFQLIGGVAESLELTGPEDQGPMRADVAMRFAKVGLGSSTDYPLSGTVPTAGLNVDAAPVFVNLTDCEVFIDDTAAGIGTTKISDAVHTLNLGIDNSLDLKQHANGSNTRFQLNGYGRGEVVGTLSLQAAKTSQTVGTGSETDDWFDNTPVKRFIELRYTDPTIITGSTPYSLSIRMAGYWITRENTDLGGNATITLNGNIYHDATLGYAIRVVLVNTLGSL